MKSRYSWLIVDLHRAGLIIMEESKDRRGRITFEVPEEYADYLHLRGIEIIPATCAEAYEYLSARLAMREKQFPGSVTPEYCTVPMVAEWQAREEYLQTNS